MQPVTTQVHHHYGGNPVVDVRPSRTNTDGYNAGTSIGLGILQIVIAILCFIFDMVARGMQVRRKERFYNSNNGALETSSGIWCGIFFLISGSLAVAAGKEKRLGLMIGAMILSIISAVFAFSMVIIHAIAVAVEESLDLFWIGTIDETSYAMAVLLLILGLAEIIVAIWTSTLYCAFCCCTNQRLTTVVPVSDTVSYINAAGVQNQTVIMQSSTVAQAPPYQPYPGGYYPQPTAQPGAYHNQPAPHYVILDPGQQHQVSAQMVALPTQPPPAWSSQSPGPSNYATRHGDTNGDVSYSGGSDEKRRY